MRAWLLLPVLLGACDSLTVIHEERADLSDFEELELDHDGHHYTVVEQGDGGYWMTFRHGMDDELVVERPLTDSELESLRAQSESVILRMRFDKMHEDAEPVYVSFIRWDDVIADTWSGNEYTIQIDELEVFYELLESFRKAEV